MFGVFKKITEWLPGMVSGRVWEDVSEKGRILNFNM